MIDTLDQKLITKYPKIFADRYGDLRTTAMCWGFSCDDGWYWLIDELCSLLQWDIDHNRQPQIVASQVKEKYGRLCFYTHSATERQQGMISTIEYLSTVVCELCGRNGATQTDNGWVKTLCAVCEVGREQRTT